MKYQELDQKANELATKISKGGDAEALNELLKLMQPIVKKEARKRSISTNGLLEYEELESLFNETVWKSAVHYKGESNFTQCLRLRLNRMAIKLYRHYTGKKQISPMMKVSLDYVDSETGESLSQILKDTEILEDQIMTKKLLDEFCQTHEHDGWIIRMLEYGFKPDEVSKMLGAPSYDGKSRQAMSRLKKKLINYLAQEEQVA
ncbi:sigma-70 family RNA polymerase sigma factor [Heliobacterium chlorum]|uniref:Sigma-70 family RNA polymerase sigma factor n=1 Tax=Heliobacterium chlorum TaxID=2698 RepID=A0ABR7T9L3_HELCL|nr:sigma-70 family RNA polymerase sigma factor [Heliobacterium chlorum]MBC9786581.1 sigma-70 family RNA polymerase sigma factor [Heliobacterium chlorum]